jgi:hypothetical protein
MQTTIHQDRLQQIQALALSSGSHEDFERGMCVMEAVSYVAGEPWSDAPQCACPVLTAFMVTWNDALPSDADRDRLLKPLIPLLVGTRSTPAVEQRRATMAADWLIRVHTPAWLRLAKLEQHADALESLPEITDFAQCPSLMPALNAARSDAVAAWDAAWAAAWDAARNAARNAAWTAGDAARNAAWAAGDAARNAAWAAGDAARNAAWAAAGDAAWDAAWAARAARAAAWDALKATTEWLQQSAVDLVRRMAATTAEA